MARRTFFSFHYQRDIWRVNQIRNIPNVTRCAAAGFEDSSLWERAKSNSDEQIKRMIDDALDRTTVTVVCIGAKTAGRKYINYEIKKSLERGNGLVGLQINHLKDQNGDTDPLGESPYMIENAGYNVYKYIGVDKLAQRIEEAALIAARRKSA